MRILMLSWRCPSHPAAGGAEIVTEEVLSRLAAAGHEVTWFSAAFPGGRAEETANGVRHVRRGRQWTVHLHAWRWLRTRKESFDRVVDQINTIPFFTPLYVDRGRRRFFIHQLAREYWWRETRGPFRLVAPLGYVAEPLYLRAYRGTAGITVSASTRADLERLGVPAAQITVVPQALAVDPVQRLEEKSGPFTVAMVSRLTPAKFFEEGIRAFALAKAAVPEARLWILGSGDPAYRERLATLVENLGLRDVEFHGRVDGETRQALLAAAHVHLFASHREGWGLVVSEAGAAGTPSVGYDAPGVRDSVGDPSLLAPIGDHARLAQRVLELHAHPERYRAAREAAWRRARDMSPEATARAFEAALA